MTIIADNTQQALDTLQCPSVTYEGISVHAALPGVPQ